MSEVTLRPPARGPCSADAQELCHPRGLGPGCLPPGGRQGVVPTTLVNVTRRCIDLRNPCADHEPLDRPVERARSHVDAAARALADVQFDGMAVLGSVQQGEQDAELGRRDREDWVFRHGGRSMNIDVRCYVTRY